MKFTKSELEYAYNGGGYIVRGWSVYQIYYGVNSGYYSHKIYTKARPSIPLTNKGYWHAMNAKEVNHLLGFELLNAN